jgi:hypothetical protein
MPAGGGFGEEFGRAAAQGEEGDAGRVEPIEPVIGGELGIEDELLRCLAVLALPEGDEAENLVRLLALANIGVRVAEHLGLGVLGEEGEDAGLAPTSLGQIMGFDERMLAEIGHGVEIEIERGAGEEIFSGELSVPEGEQTRDLLRRDA